MTEVTSVCPAPGAGSGAQPGDALDEVDTPSLILDLDAFEENLRTMQVLAERHGVALRPHAKAHRCPDISLRQVALGAQGICCQKVTEAACFIAAGLRDIHISNEVVGAPKLALLARLAAQARISVCVDNPRALESLSAALAAQGSEACVLIEIDVGQKRCGVQTPEEAVALAQAIARLPQVSFGGIQAYHGGIQHLRSHERRRTASERAARRTTRFIRALARAGFECATVTGGGTGTALFDAASGVYTEIQAGSYAFMDNDYGQLDWGEAIRFRHSLYVLVTVMSTPTALRAVADAGLKSLTAESGLPQVVGHPGLRCQAVYDEHTLLLAEEEAVRPALGTHLRLVPGHCDPTINLHDVMVAFRGRTVEAVWPISARGLSR